MSLTIEERNAIIDYRLEKAYSTYTEAEKVLSLDIYNLAANRLYYAVYYAATALLLHHGQSSHTHRGAMTLFHLHFVKTGILPAEDGALFRQLFGMRHEGDYEDFIDLSREDIEPFVELSKVFIDKINAMLK